MAARGGQSRRVASAAAGQRSGGLKRGEVPRNSLEFRRNTRSGPVLPGPYVPVPRAHWPDRRCSLPIMLTIVPGAREPWYWSHNCGDVNVADKRGKQAKAPCAPQRRHHFRFSLCLCAAAKTAYRRAFRRFRRRGLFRRRRLIVRRAFRRF